MNRKDDKKVELVDQIREQLVAASNQIAGLAADDFAGKHRLNIQADELRQRLDELSADDSEALKGWANRAGRKGAHTQADPEVLKALIISVNEGGGSM